LPPQLPFQAPPHRYKEFGLIVLIVGSASITLCSAAWSFFDYGYREALSDLGSSAQPDRLWGIDIVALGSVAACFWVYMLGVWFYWVYAVKPRL
jgi:hypothetical protein